MTKHQPKRIKNQTDVTKSGAPNMQAKAKVAASSASTGGQGVSFENRVQAVKLLHMCLGTSPSPGIAEGWKIVELRFQARVHGLQTDDLVCTVENSTGARHKVLMQMKSGLTARASAKSFQDAIGGAWLDYQQAGNFKKDLDSIVIVHDANGKNDLSGATAVAKAASMSLNAKEWLEKIETAGVSNQRKRNALSAFRTVVAMYAKQDVDDEELFNFLQHISFLSHDLAEDGTSEHIQWVQLIHTSLLVVGYDTHPSHVWSKLVTTCMALNAEAACVNLESLVDILGSDLSRAFKLVREASSQNFGFGVGVRLQALDHQNVGAGIMGGGLRSHYLPASSSSGQDYIPAARQSSADKVISGQLDHINTRIKDGKYEDAMCDLIKLGEDMKPFDEHQKARWYLMRGICKWNLMNDDDASQDFLKASELCDDDDKLVAARVRGLMLRGEFFAAAQAGRDALDRFPQSFSVWLSAKNAEILDGGTVTEQDIPIAHRGEADAFQLVALSLHRTGRVLEAAEVARKGLVLPTANFFIRDSALTYTLQSIAEDTLNIVFHMHAPNELEALNVVVTAFEPRLERLWSLQSKSTLRATIINLGYAFVILGRSQVALELLREALERGIDGPDFIRLKLEAYRRAGQLERAIEEGQDLVSVMPSDALVTFAQIAATSGKPESVKLVLSAAHQLTEDKERTIDTVRSLLWSALDATGCQEEVVQQLNEIDLVATDSIPVLVQAAHVLYRAGHQERANSCLDRAASLVSITGPRPECYMVAMALFHAKRFEECASRLEILLKPEVHSELHNDLLFCFLQFGAYTKAKKLLDSLPPGWMSDDESRHMAIQLAQEVNDWTLLKQLSIVELVSAPEHAMSWLFRITTAGRESTSELMAVLTEVPEIVTGSTRELTQIATCEMNNGFELRGLRRIYRMRRMNLTDIDVAAAHVSAIMAVRKPLPNLESELPIVVSGSYFTVIDYEGQTFTRVIDPDTISDLPDAGEFRSVCAKEVAPFLGATVGTEVAVPQVFSEPKVFRVQAIGSSYRRLLDNAHQLLKESIAQSSFLSIISLPKNEQGEMDFSSIKTQVLKASEADQQVMEGYRSAPLTIGGVCELLRRSVVDVICGWPTHKAKLDVGGGPVEERLAAAQLLSRADATYVIDAATIVELGRVDCLYLLASLPCLYCTTKSYEVIRRELEMAKLEQPVGTAVEYEGKLAVFDVTDNEWAKRIDFLQQLIEAIETHCTILPSYGPEDWKRLPKQLREVVSSEEVSTLALGLELEATLFCLDARLRLLGDKFGLKGVWPQAFLASCLASGKLSKRDYAIACFKFFISGRNFISLDAADLIFAMYQGGAWTNVVISKVQQHIAENDTDFNSALNVVVAFLIGLITSGPSQFGFVVEVTGHLAEGLARHRECPDYLADYLKLTLQHSPGFRLQNDDALSYLSLAIDSAFIRAKTEKKVSTFKGTVLFCNSPPWLLNGMSQHDAVGFLNSAVGEEQSTRMGEDSGQATSGSAISDYL